MTVIVQDKLIRIEGVGRVEDAETLTAALQAPPLRAIDLSACTDVHAAVLQALLRYRPAITGLSANPDLADWLSPLLDAKPPGDAES